MESRPCIVKFYKFKFRNSSTLLYCSSVLSIRTEEDQCKIKIRCKQRKDKGPEHVK